MIGKKKTFLSLQRVKKTDHLIPILDGSHQFSSIEQPKEVDKQKREEKKPPTTKFVANSQELLVKIKSKYTKK